MRVVALAALLAALACAGSARAANGWWAFERVTNIAMGTEIDAINEFEELAIDAKDAPTAIGLLD